MRACAVPRRALCRRFSTAPEYAHYQSLQTRWNDNDCFGHVNNAVYYTYMDDAVNAHLHSNGVGLDVQRFVAESSCRFLRPLAYPQPIKVGLRISRLGRSSVAYELGIFGGLAAAGEDQTEMASDFLAAQGAFVHVYVDENGRPTALHEAVRAALQPLVIATTSP